MAPPRWFAAKKTLDMVSTFAAIIVGACMLLFTVVNLDNMLRYRSNRSAKPRTNAIEKRIRTPLAVIGVGTIVFFIESFLYVLQGLSINLITLTPPVDLGLSFNALLEALGLVTMASGYMIFTWSVMARGQYTTSWEMGPNHRLVSCGPYRYVRHPSYLGYFLMFIGAIPLQREPLALLPLIAIPAYTAVTRIEEEMLVTRFGEQYRTYQRSVGRFFPKLTLHKSDS